MAPPVMKLGRAPEGWTGDQWAMLTLMMLLNMFGLGKATHWFENCTSGTWGWIQIVEERSAVEKHF